MLKSTYQKNLPPPSATPPTSSLPPGWTEHKAPAGQTYYHNKDTGKSTYVRPVVEAQATPQQPVIPSYASGQYAGGFSGNQFQGSPPFNQFQGLQHNQFQGSQQQHPYGGRGGRGGARGGYGNYDRKRQEPEDKPKHRYKLPGCAPWVLVKTKLGRRFVHNTETKESFWKFPADVIIAVLDFDRKEQLKKERRERGEPSEDEDEEAIAAEELAATGKAAATAGPSVVPAQAQQEDEDSSEYEEIEVTDSEGEEDGEGASKRQRTEEAEQPVDFDEDDIAYQLQAMGEEYGLDPGEYGVEGEGEEWEEGAEGLGLTEDDSNALFRDLLEDFGVNPYTPWDTIIEQGIIIEDERYLALPNMKSRRECFDEWSRGKIQQIREQREKEAKKDPKIPYFMLLEEYATVKLYWPEFKRKYRNEPAMKSTKLQDRDREKWYREHIKRLKLPQSTLKTDLSTLLKSQPLSLLNRSTTIETLPPAILTDLRFISLRAKTRDPLVEAYITTLPPPPTDGLSAEEEAAEAARRKDREKREQALADRRRYVEDEQRKQDKDLAFGRRRLKEEEMELQRAMNVGKGGLKGQLEQLGGNDVVMKDTAEKAASP
jgi:hypothetical protein